MGFSIEAFLGRILSERRKWTVQFTKASVRVSGFRLILF